MEQMFQLLGTHPALQVCCACCSRYACCLPGCHCMLLFLCFLLRLPYMHGLPCLAPPAGQAGRHGAGARRQADTGLPRSVLPGKRDKRNWDRRMDRADSLKECCELQVTQVLATVNMCTYHTHVPTSLGRADPPARISLPHYLQYTDGAPVLRNVTFSVPGGSTVALVGATGSGKSTILRLLFR